jgi:Tol biopolymer transport system component/DNA-binding winged helix-turn-helix (wHTH) protein
MAPRTPFFEFDDFQIQPGERRLLRKGEVIPLHGKAFELLIALIRHAGRLLTKDELLALVWPDQIVEESNLTVNMSAVRRALGERASAPRYITTVSGCGYRFTADVRQVVEPPAAGLQSAAAPARAHRRLLYAAAAVVAIAGAGMSMRFNGHRASAAPLPWSNVTVRRFTTQGGVPYRVAISPDGKSQVYRQRINGKDTLWLGHIDSNSSVLINDRTDFFYQALMFAPDGQVYVTGNAWGQPRAKLARMPAVGGAMTDVVQNVSGPATFSPDGRLAFLRRDEGRKQTAIVIADARDGAHEHVLSTRTAPDDFSSLGLSWSPDGRTIAVGTNTGARRQTEIVGIDVQSGVSGGISTRAWGVVGNLAWSPDGSGLLVMTKENAITRHGQIWFVPFPRGEARRVTNDVDIYLPGELSVSAGGVLAVLQGHLTSEIRIAPDGDPTRSRRALKGMEPQYEAVDGLAWTGDGRLLFSSYVGGGQGIWEMESDGARLRHFTMPPRADVVDRQIAATRDGRYVVFQSNRSGTFQIWRTNADGGDLTQLTFEGTSTQPGVSADGRSIVYVSETTGGSGLRRMSIDGGNAVALTDRRSASPEVSPDGHYIAYFEAAPSQPLRLAVMPFAGGGPVKIFAVPHTVIWPRELCWTPDGKAILYKDSIEGLWHQSLDQDKPRPAKGFEGVEVYQLGWSFDGRSLAYSTGARMQDIVLIENAK